MWYDEIEWTLILEGAVIPPFQLILSSKSLYFAPPCSRTIQVLFALSRPPPVVAPLFPYLFICSTTKKSLIYFSATFLLGLHAVPRRLWQYHRLATLSKYLHAFFCRKVGERGAPSWWKFSQIYTRETNSAISFFILMSSLWSRERIKFPNSMIVVLCVMFSFQNLW